MLKWTRLLYILFIICKQALQFNQPVSQRIRIALEQLGPIFIKFGQLLSTRIDILSEEFVLELSKLQDQVQPFHHAIAIKIIEQTLNQGLHELFLQFDAEPIAAASIAQVHAATLPNGEAVAIKILRPNIHKVIKRDLSWIKWIAKLLEYCVPTFQSLNLTKAILEIERTLEDELDLLKEAANAAQLKRNFEGSQLLYVPKIHWPYTRHNILVSERIYGIPVSHLADLKTAQVDLKLLAERAIELFFTQVFRDCFFHADMHPGNIWVNPQNPHNPQYLALDFGIMGTLSHHDQMYLAHNLLAFLDRNYKKVAQLHIESGWVPSNTRADEFESAIRMVCEPIFAKPLEEISFGQTLLRLFQTAHRFKMEIQPQLILLQKTLINIEGLGRQLYPGVNLWEIAQPVLEKWLKTQMGHRALWEKIKTNVPFWLAQLPDLPLLFHENLMLEKKWLSQALQSKAHTLHQTTWHGWLKPLISFCLGVFIGYQVFLLKQ